MAGFIYPPHPQTKLKIRPESLDRLEQEGGWIAQRKYNGSHCVVHIKKGKVQIWNRIGEPFRTYQLMPSMIGCFLQGIDDSLELVLDGELLHTKAKSKITNKQAQTNTIVLYDILFCNRILLQMPFEERYNLLSGICGKPKIYEPKKRGLAVSKVEESELWLAENFLEEFAYRFYEMYEFDREGNDKFPEIEGLVCKRGKGSFLNIGNTKYDVSWMMRVRKTKEKIYLF